MKQGATYNLALKIDIDKPYNEVIFRLKSNDGLVERVCTSDDSGVFIIPLTQEDTLKLKGKILVEAQVNYEDKSVEKSTTKQFYVHKTLGTKIIDGNKPNIEDGDLEKVLEMINGDIVLIISPESSAELIRRVTNMFSETKQIAQSVRDDADAGKFDGEPGPQGPPGPKGSYTAGYGIKIDGDEISIDLPEAESEEY